MSECLDEEHTNIRPNSKLFVMMRENKVASYAYVQNLGKNRFYLYNACTKLQFRNKGYMSRLIRYIVSRLCVHNKFIVIDLLVDANNINAVKVYTKAGFVKVSTLDKGIILMRLIARILLR